MIKLGDTEPYLTIIFNFKLLGSSYVAAPDGSRTPVSYFDLHFLLLVFNRIHKMKDRHR